MNKSVYIITTITTLIFLVGFLFVRATHKSNLTVMKLGLSINSEPVDLRDTISIYSSDLLLLEHLKKTGDESITEWHINGESKSLGDALKQTFKDAGVYSIKATNPSTIDYEFVLVVETPEDATLTLQGGTHHRIGHFCTIVDETEEVESRQWIVNGEMIEDDSDILKFKPIRSGNQVIKVVNRLENGKLAVAELSFEVEDVLAKKPAPVASGGGGGGSSASSSISLTNRITNIGYPVNLDDTQLAIVSSKEGKKLLTATLSASSKMNLTQFAIKGKNRKGQISISVLDKNGQVIENKLLECKPQNLYISLNDGSGIDLKADESLSIWIELTGGAEIANVANKNNSNFKPYPGFEITFEKDLIWMFDLEVWTP